MPKLIFTDGREKDVSYEVASKVFAILKGRQEPEDDKQRQFVESVKVVEWEDTVKPEPNKRSPKKSYADPEIDKILSDKKLKGAEKARAIAARIKERKSGNTTS